MQLTDAGIKTYLDLCANPDEKKITKLIIPFYQRPYLWDDAMIQQLLGDFFDNSEKSNMAHYFAGTAVVVKSDENSLPSIIDGQQRTTTLYLLNFILFLLKRSSLESEFIIGEPSSINGILSSLAETYSYVTGNNDTESFKEARNNVAKELMGIGKREDSQERWNIVTTIFRKAVGLPQSEPEEGEKYKNEYSDELKKLLPKKLALSYSLPSYNEKLRQSLVRAVVLNHGNLAPSLELYGSPEGETEQRYCDALVCLFNCLAKRSEGQSNPLAKMIEYCTEALNNIQLCLLQTKEVSDAYMLFEVLNDRALAVDDLDLIKNKFFQTYALSAEGNTDPEGIEKVIEVTSLLLTPDSMPRARSQASCFRILQDSCIQCPSAA